MSRVGKRVIKIPSGVKVDYKHPRVEVSGKIGKVNCTLASSISIEIKGDELSVKNTSNEDGNRALHGLSRTILQNMVTGVTTGYSKELELQGVGYRAQTQGNKLTLSVGFSHPVEFLLPPAVTATVEANTKIVLKSPDKMLLGLTAANLRKVKPPEPYKGKGIRYFGEVITLKQGKTAASGGAK